MEKRTYRYYRKLATCGNRSQEPQPKKKRPNILKAYQFEGFPVWAKAFFTRGQHKNRIFAANRM